MLNSMPVCQLRTSRTAAGILIWPDSESCTVTSLPIVFLSIPSSSGHDFRAAIRLNCERGRMKSQSLLRQGMTSGGSFFFANGIKMLDAHFPALPAASSAASRRTAYSNTASCFVHSFRLPRQTNQPLLLAQLSGAKEFPPLLFTQEGVTAPPSPCCSARHRLLC